MLYSRKATTLAGAEREAWSQGLPARGTRSAALAKAPRATLGHTRYRDRTRQGKQALPLT